MDKTVHSIDAIGQYYCLLEDYGCEVNSGEDCDAGSAECREARTRNPEKCPYRVEKTW